MTVGAPVMPLRYPLLRVLSGVSRTKAAPSVTVHGDTESMTELAPVA